MVYRATGKQVAEDALLDLEEKWTSPLHNWSLTVQQLYIKFGDRLPLDLMFSLQNLHNPINDYNSKSIALIFQVFACSLVHLVPLFPCSSCSPIPLFPMFPLFPKCLHPWASNTTMSPCMEANVAP